MNGVIRDKYILGESIGSSIVKANDELEINLVLNSNSNNFNLGRIEGNVYDSNNNSIENSVIKLEAIDKKNKMQAITDINGRYVFENVPVNIYTIAIYSRGMIVQKTSQFQVIELSNIIMNFTLEKDLNANKSIIVGDVFDSANNTLIYNVIVLLFEIKEDGSRNLISRVYTNQFGQFAFRGVYEGEYFLIFDIHGYIQYFTNLSIATRGQIASLKINMIQDPSQISKIISGVISDTYGNPISGAYVSLYPVLPNKSTSNSIAITTTNQDGIYVFTDISKGSYRVTYATPNS